MRQKQRKRDDNEAQHSKSPGIFFLLFTQVSRESVTMGQMEARPLAFESHSALLKIALGPSTALTPRCTCYQQRTVR